MGDELVHRFKDLPRLSALRMFESAARQMSFTRAADELRVTQAAVSQQVRGLERELGVQLFTRQHRGLELTRQGMKLQRAVAMAFDYVSGTVAELRAASRTEGLTVGMTFAMTTFWLLPRLHEFRTLYPNINLRLIATDGGFDKIAQEVDVGIAFGDGAWPGFTTTLLRHGEIFPVCSPDYLRGRPHLKEPGELQREVLLHLDDSRPGIFTWPIWLAENGVATRSCQSGIKLNNHSLLLQAACDGQGIALGWNLLTDDLIAARKLIRPMHHTMRTRRGFFVLSSDRNQSADVAAFRDWILSCTADSARAPACGAGREDRRARRSLEGLRVARAGIGSAEGAVA